MSNFATTAPQVKVREAVDEPKSNEKSRNRDGQSTQARESRSLAAQHPTTTRGSSTRPSTDLIAPNGHLTYWSGAETPHQY